MATNSAGSPQCSHSGAPKASSSTGSAQRRQVWGAESSATYSILKRGCGLPDQPWQA